LAGEVVKCFECDKLRDNFCTANLWEDYPVKCFIKMMIQELRLLNISDEENGEEWKYPREDENSS